MVSLIDCQMTTLTVIMGATVSDSEALRTPVCSITIQKHEKHLTLI
jgi:hypothetical protein